jgi:ADP-ribose pyrophosphatase YjhB (NUDIX family)
MATPDFILRIRERIGHDLLWLPGVTGVVLDADDRVLLVRRSDDGRWTLVTGVLDPGEQPAVGLVREIYEETGVEAEVERLVSVEATEPSAYPNGDQVQYLDLAFRCRALGGEARVNDDESTEVGWFALDALPELSPLQARCLADALGPDLAPRFVIPQPAASGPSPD